MGFVALMRAHKQEIHIFPTLFKFQGTTSTPDAVLQASEPWRLVGGRGRVNPPPRRLVWRFWKVWRVWCWFEASTCLEARGFGGLYLISWTMAILKPLTNSSADEPKHSDGKGDKTSIQHKNNFPGLWPTGMINL